MYRDPLTGPIKPVYKLSNVPDDLKWATNTHMTPFTLTLLLLHKAMHTTVA